MFSNSSRVLRRISVSAVLVGLLFAQTDAMAMAAAAAGGGNGGAGAAGTGAGPGGAPAALADSPIRVYVVVPPNDRQHPSYKRLPRATNACPLDDPRCHKNTLD